MAAIHKRATLQQIRDLAQQMAKLYDMGFPMTWQRAWLDLADAADRLDAMTARKESLQNGNEQGTRKV